MSQVMDVVFHEPDIKFTQFHNLQIFWYQCLMRRCKQGIVKDKTNAIKISFSTDSTGGRY